MIAHIQAPAAIGGRITAPPSKSMAHRAVLCAALARGTSRVENLEFSQDVDATLTAAARLGAQVERGEGWAQITGSGSVACPDGPVDCCESGSTLRFLIPVFSLCGRRVEFSGRGRLLQRPMGVYEKLFREQGLEFDQSEGGLAIRGPLAAGDYTIPGDVSSQFISGLLFALPLLQGDSTLTITPPFESRSYVELTLAALRDFGVQVDWADETRMKLLIPGGQCGRGRDYRVEGDYSQAAFFAVLGAVLGGITIQDLRPDSLQGDGAILPILERCGARFVRQGSSVTFEKAPLSGTVIDLADCPDLGPILMALALFCEGETRIINAGRLRIKESDRIAAMEEELRKFGADMESTQDTVTIRPAELHAPAELDSHNDHRVVMSLAMAALCAGVPVTIRDAGAVAKSWPDFFRVLERAGAQIEVRDE